MALLRTKDNCFETFYDEHYRQQGQHEGAWLRYCSVEKVDSIIQCTSGRSIHDVIEIGCGTGAILEELNRRDFADNYWAIDLSAEAIQFVTSLDIPKLRMAAKGRAQDICALFKRRFDLVILSHVVEHVPEPHRLLLDALQCADFVFVEVPIESTPGLNLKWRLLKLFGRKREENIAGHIQFFSKKGLDELIADVGARVLASREYVPMNEELLRLNGIPLLKRRVMLMLFKILGERRWAQLWYSHYAVILTHTSP